jgi:hypothetical protein
MFRKPVYPVILDVNGLIIGAKTLKQLEDDISEIHLPAGEHLPLIDSSGEGWSLAVDHMVISPLTFKKKWTKKEIITLFNNSEMAKKTSKEYSFKSISAKRFDRIVLELVDMIRC